MYTGPTFAPLRSINNQYGNGRTTLGWLALTNTLSTVNGGIVGNIVGGIVGGVVGAIVGGVVGPVCKIPNLGRIGQASSPAPPPRRAGG